MLFILDRYGKPQSRPFSIQIFSPDSSGKAMQAQNRFLWWRQSDQRKLLPAPRKRV